MRRTQPDITIKTPAIQAIQARMASRFDSQLRAHFDSGALGFANDGTDRRARCRQDPAEGARRRATRPWPTQNRDAKAVYREIAVANNHPEWEAADPRGVRAAVDRQRPRRAGGCQDAGGGWKQK